MLYRKTKSTAQRNLRFSEKVEGQAQLTLRVSKFQRFLRFFIENLSALRIFENLERLVQCTLRIFMLPQLILRISKIQRFSRCFIEKLSALCNAPCAFVKM